jgi:hypothetical protein
MFNDLPLDSINRNKYFQIIPKKPKIGLIKRVFESYRKSQTMKDIKLTKKIKDKNEQLDIKVLKGLGIFSMNKSIIDTLFRKTPLKIKNDVLTILSKEKANSNIYLNPFLNSYGYLLDDLSEKIGFMKDSINMIYPMMKIKNNIRTKKNNELYKKIKIKKNRYKIEELNNDENIKRNNIKLYKIVKPKTIIKNFFTKYPVTIPRNGDKGFSSKKYSLKRQQKLIDID